MRRLPRRPAPIACLCSTALLLTAAAAAPDEPHSSRVPMTEHASGNFYVAGTLNGTVATELLVDTGAGYVSLTRATFERLRVFDRVEPVREIVGEMADGSRLPVPIYRIAELTLGTDCVLRDVEVAVMARGSDILGLNALRRLEPFSLSLTPPELSLSGCGRRPAFSAAADDAAEESMTRSEPSDRSAAPHARR